jgi:hypothetical protein
MGKDEKWSYFCVCPDIDHTALNDRRMNDELERIGREALLA